MAERREDIDIRERISFDRAWQLDFKSTPAFHGWVRRGMVQAESPSFR